MRITLLVATIMCAASADPVNPALGPGDDGFITRQSEAFLAEVAKTLDTVPPAVPEPRARAGHRRVTAVDAIWLNMQRGPSGLYHMTLYVDEAGSLVYAAVVQE